MIYTASLRFLPLGSINLTFGEASAIPGNGSHRFALEVAASGTWLDPDDVASYVPVLLGGAAWIDNPARPWVGELISRVIIVRGYQTHEHLALDLPDDQLIVLERDRAGQDIGLRLDLRATLLGAPPDVHPVVDEQVGYRIGSTRWLEILDQLGTEVGIMLRVPSPLTDTANALPPSASDEDAASLAQASARLRQARAELRDHQWEHCVATCRRVLENLGRLVPMPSIKQVAAVVAQRRNQEERWAAIYYDVAGMASAAHHDDDTTSGFVWTRADAEAILAATAGLLNRYTPSSR